MQLKTENDIDEAIENLTKAIQQAALNATPVSTIIIIIEENGKSRLPLLIGLD